MWNKVECALMDSQKLAGQLEACSDSKGIQSVLHGGLFNIIFGYVGFIFFLGPIDFSHGLCLNNFLQVWLIGNQIYQVPLLRNINQYDGVSHLVRGWKVLGGMKYLLRSVK